MTPRKEKHHNKPAPGRTSCTGRAGESCRLMTLANRLSWFFLVALAVVLVGFSASLYLLARTYLYRQADDRLETALNTLAAIAEVKPDGVEWEPEQRRLSLGQDDAAEHVRWTAQNGEGRILDRSRNLGAEDLFEYPVAVPVGEEPPVPLAYRMGQPWRLRRQMLQPGRSPAALVSREGAAREEEHRHDALILTVGMSLQPLQATLRNLAVALTTLSLTLWLVAALLGRWLCRRALVPVTRMATAARAMSAADLGQCLPGPGTGDELEDLAWAFNDLLSRVQDAFERQRRFTGDASHQLRTPLTAVLGQVEVALLKDRTAEDYRQALRLVHRQASQLRQIVEALLFLARAEAEAGLPDLEAVDLADWVPGYLQVWSGHPRYGDLRVECTCTGPLCARVHAPLLGQLLTNLLDNACKYSEPGTSISLRLAREPGVITLAVEDAGCGINLEDLRHVFEPFYRSAHARCLGRVGVGLGLAVAQRLAQVFSGMLSAESEPGRGSRFLLRLPELIADSPRSAGGSSA